jgi:predicted permease
MSLPHKLRTLLRRSRLERDMAEEMRAHLEEQTQRNLAAGMSEHDARAAAHRQFGGVAQIQEHARDVRHLRWLDDLARDVRLALRNLRKSPGFTLIAVLTLAFGIGVNTSMFTAIEALLRPEQAYPEPDHLVHVFRTSPHSQRWPHSPANFLEQKATNEVFTGMAAFAGRSLNLSDAGRPAERVRGMAVTPEFFPLLGIAPALGRTFSPEDDVPGQDAVAVLSHTFWLTRLGADPEVIGRTLRLNGETVTVIGVMPERFRDLMAFGPVQVWQPMAFTEAERANRGGNYLKSIARLKPGVSLREAQTAMDVIAARQERDHADTNSLIGLRLARFGESMDPRGERMVWLTMTLAGFVLLIACANLANLQFARTVRRLHELAIRGALGAGRGRLLRQLLTESLVVAALGGVLGLMLASWCNPLLEQQLRVNAQHDLTLELDVRVLTFALAATALSGLAFGLLPAWRVSRVDLNRTLKQGARGATTDRAQHRIQHALIVGETALALILLAGAGLLMNGLHRFTQRDPGWSVAALSTGYLNLPDKTYVNDAARAAFVQRLQEELAALPGVESAALAWSVPLRAYNVAGDFSIEGRPPPPPGREPLRFVNGVTPGFFETLGIPLLAGRTFTAADHAQSSAVVIINETMARTFWPGESPLGRHISGEEIIGVVADVEFAADPSEPSTRLQSYRPFAQSPRNFLALAVRGPVTALELRQAVAAVDSDLPLNEAETASDVITRAVGSMRIAGRIVTGFAVLGLVLASLGIYGVISGFVAQKSHEIGVRMALGAGIRDVLWLVLGRGLRLTLIGAAVGLAGAFGFARILRSIAPGLEPGDPSPIIGVTALLIVIGLLACWLPARRAARIDPLQALRTE